MLYPLTFVPIFKERVWGNRRLEELYGKAPPAGVPIGESWEISDRPGDISSIAHGPLAGKDLHGLMQGRRAELLGTAAAPGERFPLLIKILDCRQTLSLQVHPPPHKAAEFGGEPKTEFWYIAAAQPGAELFVGLKRGVTRSQFEKQIQDGTVAECFHRIRVRAGDAMFLPSGRVHALGAGLVVFEVQQNSDTTYRVFDWNRVGLDGQPRPLHLAQALASINFEDYEPALLGGDFTGSGPVQTRPLVRDSLFSLDLARTLAQATFALAPGRMQIIGLLSGALSVHSGVTTVSLSPGQFCLLPACLNEVLVQAGDSAKFLRIEAGD
jgi:mannose-6-phosphate isomerase